jgi:hypothetical protein
VPIRVELFPAKDGEPAKYATTRDIQALRQGMSAAVVIDTAKSER